MVTTNGWAARAEGDVNTYTSLAQLEAVEQGEGGNYFVSAPIALDDYVSVSYVQIRKPMTRKQLEEHNYRVRLHNWWEKYCEKA